jgi:putative ABC transport system permease protein
MRLIDLIGLIFENLNRRKGRVALTAIGVVIGTASVVLLVSLASGLQQSATSQIGNIGDLTTIQVYPGYRDSGMMMAGGGGGGEMPEQILLTPKTIKDIEAIPGVIDTFIRIDLWSGAQINFGKLVNYGQITAFGSNDVDQLGYALQEGAAQIPRGGAVIGGFMANNFMDPQMRPGQEPPAPPDLLGKQLKITVSRYSEDGEEVKKVYNLRVVGIMKETRGEQDSMLIVNFEDMKAINDWVNGKRVNYNETGYSQVLVKASDTKTVTEVTTQITEMGFYAFTPQMIVQGINSLYTIMQLIFAGVGAISLLVAAIGIANTMTMAILERTREIGLMKAVGASNRDVLSIFLGEAAGIGFLGGVGGVLLGWGGSKVLNVVAVSYLASRAAENGGAPVSVAVYTPLWLPLVTLLFATLIGLLSGLYPALRAATIAPVLALKYE